MTARMLARRVVRCAVLVGFLTVAAGALTDAAVAADAWQTPQSIRDAARARALERFSGKTATIEAVGVDERLQLPACGQELDTAWQREIRNGQGTVIVSCATGDRWRLFVPVRVVEQVSVVLARRNLAVGEVLTEADLDVRTQSSTSLPLDFIGDPSQAIGLTVRRTVPSGALLAAAALEKPEIIARGALVTLVSGSGSVRVKSEGVALEGGRVKERIRVKSPSGRVVEGVVEASGEVRVGT